MSNQSMTTVRWKIAVLIWMGAIAYLSLLPPRPDYHPSAIQETVHNFMHIPAYALLTYLLVRSFSSITGKAQWCAFLIAFFYGILMEFLQTFVPGRLASLGDVARNALGSILIILYFRYFAKVSFQ